jgi:hypothetical protein
MSQQTNDRIQWRAHTTFQCSVCLNRRGINQHVKVA